MFELPSDPPRLRMILDFLDEQVARNQTIGIYLSVQQKAVRHALSVAEGHAETARQQPRLRGRRALSSPAAGPAPSRSGRGSTGFMIERRRTPSGPEEVAVHQDDCTMTSDHTHRIGAHEARLALTETQLEACPFCRPDTELGIFG
ncbi:DUF6233 domain-containing protein [Streptomyces viridochromogenes]|uniref:DUF6233 domain-containing protein n=1 Tax=Streptomyces viridochromogenes TaxID=1938 RepID=UPI0031E0FF68